MRFGGGMGRTTLDKVVREGLFKEMMTLKLRPKGVSDVDIWRKRIPGRGKSQYKDPEMRWVWCV